MRGYVLEGNNKMSKRNKGFTLAELLIVVAVIAVLVAISIPIFSSQLEKSRRAVDLSNARNMKSILMNSYASGTIVFPGAQEEINDGNGNKYSVNTYVAVIVNKENTEYRASGTVRINGKVFTDDKLVAYQRVKELFAGTGFDNMRVHAKNTSNDGWASYCVILRADGTCRILSSTEPINMGGTDGGVFENTLENLMKQNETNIEKAMN